jgi:hypothetical protein
MGENVHPETKMDLIVHPLLRKIAFIVIDITNF